MNPTSVLMQAVNISKAYGGVRALKGVSIELYAGEVHALCGENGSGKSTLLKVLSAQIKPDGGLVQMRGLPANFRSPVESLRAGIATVTQERSLVRELSVAENIMMGASKIRGPLGINWAKTRQRAAEILEVLECNTSVDTVVADLPPGQAQIVEIARAISGDMKVLILDEPTSSLSTHEVESLFKAVSALRASGVAIVFISHRMKEVFDLSDRITVLRDGDRVSSGQTGEYTPDRVIADMLGRELSNFSVDTSPGENLEPILTFSKVSLERKYDNVSFSLGRGEILGIAGLVGAGHSEIVESIFGIHPKYEGEISVRGQVTELRNPPSAMRQRIAFVPGDRKINGLVLEMSVLENAIMASTSIRARFKPPRPTDAVSFVTECINQFNIVTESIDSPVVRLSGGNQQKVLLSKWIGTQPEILVLDEPTRGVDVGAKAEIYRILLKQRDQGMSILVSSSEVPELLALCDRILVMHAGQVVGLVDREQANEDIILKMAMGHA